MKIYFTKSGSYVSTYRKQPNIQQKPVHKNLEFQVREGSYLKEHLMFKVYITENFSLKVLKIAVLIYGFLLQWKTAMKMWFKAFETETG